MGSPIDASAIMCTAEGNNPSGVWMCANKVVAGVRCRTPALTIRPQDTREFASARQINQLERLAVAIPWGFDPQVVGETETTEKEAPVSVAPLRAPTVREDGPIPLLPLYDRSLNAYVLGAMSISRGHRAVCP
jgi:hypothetical protein